MDRVALCPRARSCATWRPRSLRASPRRRSPASSTASWSTWPYPLRKDAAVRIVTDRSPEALPLYRHSTAHLLAAAVTNLFPGAQCGIGPATDEGFFYDFVVERPFVPEDLEAIEQKMKELAAQDLVYERQMWPRDEAKAFFAERGEPLKVQLIEEKTEGQTEVSCYTIKDKETFVDFCVGPHVPSTGKLKAFKLLSTSNAYWKGDARNQPMQRIYGTAFFSDKDLKAHLTQIEEAKKRDHRKLGRELGLFTFHPVGAGRGVLARQGHDALQHARRTTCATCCFPAGYVEVKTPLVYNKALWETSGHWAALPPEHVPHRVGRRADEHEGDELPRPLSCIYAQRGAQLPRSADPLSRADAAAPQRGVGRAVGPDARPPVLAGRCALLRDAGADRRRGRAAARGWCSASTATSA